MCTSYVIMASRVAPPAEDKGAELDGAKEAKGVTVLVWGCLGRSCASLRLTVVASMALITVKEGDLGKETEKWRSIYLIAEGKMSLSRVTIFL